MLAAKNGYDEIVSMLMRHNANVSVIGSVSPVMMLRLI